MQQFEALSTPIWIFDVDRHNLWWGNQAALEFWDARTLDELTARDFSSDSASVRTRLRQIVDGAGADGRLQDTWTLYPKNNPRTAVLSFQPVTIEENISAVMVEIVRLTEQQTNDEDIRIFEAARTSAFMISSFSTSGKLLVQNPAALNCYGPVTEPNDTVPGDLGERFANKENARRILEAVQKNGEIDEDFNVLTLDGLRVHRICARRGRDPVTADFVVVLNEEDITDASRLRRRLVRLNEGLEAEVAERTSRLKESEERYALAARTAAIWDWNIADNSVFVSPSFIENLGYEPDEFMEKIHRSGTKAFVHPDETAAFRKGLINHLKNPGAPLQYEHRFVTRDGKAIWYHAQGITLHDDAGRAVRSVGLLTDISKRKSLEASLLSTQRLEAIGQLTGGIAHDFNNLLTVIQGNAQLLELNEFIDSELTASIVSAAEKGAELTRHLLAYSGKQTLLPRQIDLGELLETMRKTILRVLSEDISVQIEVPDDPIRIFADQNHLESALLNLALNARDAMPRGGTLTLMCRPMLHDDPNVERVTCPNAATGGCVEICISDTGTGMSSEVAERAFEPFFTTKDVGKGSGLGLSMVLGFSRQSNGDANITKNKHGGATVSIFLPRSVENSIAPTTHAIPRNFSGNGELVHLVEDDPDVRAAMRRLLETLNYRVIQSSSAAEAETTLKRKIEPDIHLVDVVLPGGVNGLEFTQSLREADPTARVILMSGFPKLNLPDETKIDPSLAFLQKPVESHVLSQALRGALQS
ncbi:MAG: ATP-binding protein [Paracoccaceae bacterium]